MLYRTNIVALFAFAALALMAASDTHAQQSTDGLPEWLQKEMQRESRRAGKKRDVSLLDDALTFEVPSKKKVEPSERFDWGQYITVDIGSDSPMECLIYAESAGQGALLQSVSDHAIDSIVSNNAAELDSRSIISHTVDHIDGRGFLSVEWLIVVLPENGEKAASAAKAAVTSVSDHPVACMHTGLGYSETFNNAFASIVRTIKSNTEQTQPFYQETQLISVSEQTIGFATTSYTIDEDGDTMMIYEESSALPADASTLATTDAFLAEWSRPDGTMINSVVSDIENGERTQRLTLEVDDAGVWLINGDIQGKSFTSELPDIVDMPSTTLQQQLVRDIVSDPDRTSGDIVAWVPDVDPGALSTFVFTQGDDARSGTASIGPLNIQMQLAADGLVNRMDAELAGITLTSERVWFAGSVPELK